MNKPNTDILEKLTDLYTQATCDRRHSYAQCCQEAIQEIARLRIEVTKVEALQVQLMSHGINPVVRRSA